MHLQAVPSTGSLRLAHAVLPPVEIHDCLQRSSTLAWADADRLG